MTRDATMASELSEIALTTNRMTGRKAASRRRWTAEQKRAIVAESLMVGASVAGVARRHAITAGQIYAWLQQLLAHLIHGPRAVEPR
jgi:transposase-like protein